MKKLFCITTTGLALLACPALAETASSPVLSDKDVACIELSAHREELEKSLGFSVQQEFKDEKVLVDFSGQMAYMTPQQSVAYYNERIRHIKNVAGVLGCKQQKGSAI